MSIAIKVENLSKCYQIYENPRDRLKQFVMPRMHRIAGNKPKQYFSEFWALKDVSFEIKKGETVGIIGRNGSGKSTLLQMICGTLNPTSGSVQTNGRIAALLELGSGFNTEFTGRENVFMNAAVLGLTKEEIASQLNNIISFADIGDFIDQPVKTYSSGMVVRLAFSVAAHVDPELLIIDEALAVGDFVFQQKCFKRIQELQNNGCSILLVSHDLSSIIQFCSKAYLLSHGKMVSGGSAKEAVDLYKRLSTEVSNIPKSIYGGESLKTSLSSAKQEYGSKTVEIYDWAVLDEHGNQTTTIASESATEIVVLVKFVNQCIDPIVGYFFTDAQGREIVGTNTWYSRTPIGERSPGEIVEIRFKQVFGLTSGEYSLNLGCSEFVNNKLIAHHRLYDLCTLQTYRMSSNLGFFLPPTIIEIKKIK